MGWPVEPSEEYRIFKEIVASSSPGPVRPWFELDARESSLYIAGNMGSDFLTLPAGSLRQEGLDAQAEMLRDLSEGRLAGLGILSDGRVRCRQAA